MKIMYDYDTNDESNQVSDETGVGVGGSSQPGRQCLYCISRNALVFRIYCKVKLLLHQRTPECVYRPVGLPNALGVAPHQDYFFTFLSNLLN